MTLHKNILYLSIIAMSADVIWDFI